MPTFQRIQTVDHAGQRRTRILEVVDQTERFVTGYRVNAEAEHIGSGGADQTIEVIDAKAITRRTPLEMDRRYGVLRAPGAKADDGVDGEPAGLSARQGW